MTALVAVLLWVTASPDGGPAEVEVVTPDGGDIPTLVPVGEKLTRALAPERGSAAADAGVTDAGVPVVVADPTLTVYKVNLPIEATVTAASLALYLFVDLMIKPTLEGDLSCRQPVGNGRCNPADLTGLDRYSVGRSSREWATFSDVALAGAMVIPILYLGLESIFLPTVSPLRDFANDLMIISESLALSGAFQLVLKFAIRRPRPARYADLESPTTDFDAELSFPSGHTMLVASATTALTTTVFLRHPKSPMRWVVLGAGGLLTAMTALARVEAGAHFPTDVIVASLLGAFTGFIVPYLHKKELPVTPVGGINPIDGSGSIGVQGRF